MKKGTRDKLDNLLSDLDFKGIGDKMSEFSRILEILKASKKDNSSKKKIPKKYHFLLDLSEENAGKIYKEVEERNRRALKQYRELKAVFKKWDLNISKDKLNSIAYPKGFKRIEADLQGEPGKSFYLHTCKRMREWYEENAPKGMKLFKVESAIEGIEETVLKNKSFGFFSYEKSGVLHRIKTLQTAVFYGKNRRKGRKPKIRNAHLLMLFDILRFFEEMDVEQFKLRLGPEFVSNTVKEQNEDYKRLGKETIGALVTFKKG